jgi:hypothetical protein
MTSSRFCERIGNGKKQHLKLMFFLMEDVLHIIELSVKSSKESTETVSLLKIGNKVVEVG